MFLLISLKSQNLRLGQQNLRLAWSTQWNLDLENKRKQANKNRSKEGRREGGREEEREEGEEKREEEAHSCQESSSLFTPFLIYLKKLSFRPDRGRKPSWWIALQHLSQRTRSLAHLVRAVLRMLGDPFDLCFASCWLLIVCGLFSTVQSFRFTISLSWPWSLWGLWQNVLENCLRCSIRRKKRKLEEPSLLSSSQ